MKTIYLSVFLFSMLSFSQQSVSLDLDNDGIDDQVNCMNIEQGFKISYNLSSQKDKNFVTETVTVGGQAQSLTASKNILILKMQYNRAENYYKFRYSTKLGRVIMIGFDTKAYGNATNDGSGTSSLNLLTGDYQGKWKKFNAKTKTLVNKPVVVKKFTVKTYFLDDLSDMYLTTLDSFVK